MGGTLRKRVKRFQSKNYTSSPRTDRMFFFLPCPLSRPKDEISSHCRAVFIWGAIGSGGIIRLRHNVHHFLLHDAARDALVERLVGTRELPCYIW